MDQSAKPISAPQASETPGFINKALRVLTFPVALAAGAWTTYINVRASTIEKSKQFGRLKEISQKFSDQLEQDFTLRENNLITREDFAARAVANKAKQSVAVNGHIAELGLDGLKTRWLFINKASRQKAIVEGLTVAGITIGAILTIANTKSLSEFFLGESKDNDQQR